VYVCVYRCVSLKKGQSPSPNKNVCHGLWKRLKNIDCAISKGKHLPLFKLQHFWHPKTTKYIFWIHKYTYFSLRQIRQKHRKGFVLWCQIPGLDLNKNVFTRMGHKTVPLNNTLYSSSYYYNLFSAKIVNYSYNSVKHNNLQVNL